MDNKNPLVDQFKNMLFSVEWLGKLVQGHESGGVRVLLQALQDVAMWKSLKVC